jgi:hypothetical protein
LTGGILSFRTLEYVTREQQADAAGVAASAIQSHVDRPRATVNHALARLVEAGALERVGAGRAVRYRLARIRLPAPSETALPETQPPRAAPAWSNGACQLLAALSAPLGTREAITYQRRFVDDYQPNVTSMLPAALAAQLHAKGQSNDQQPAGTYARKVLKQLLIDLS